MPLADGLKGFVIGGRTNLAGTAQNPDVDQEELRMAFASLCNAGLLPNNFDGSSAGAAQWQVTQDTGSNMVVRVGSASTKRDACMLRGGIGQGLYVARIDDPNGYVAVTAPATDPTFPAKYSVFLYVNDATYGGDAGRSTFGIACLRGTPAASPTPPNPLSTWSAYMRLWTFQLAANATAITNAILNAGTRDILVGGINSRALNLQSGQFIIGGFGQVQIASVDGSLIPAGTLPPTALPAYMPRGRIAETVVTASTNGITGTSDLAGMSVGWTANPNRYYRTTIQVNPNCDNNGSYAQLWIRDQSNNNKQTTGLYPHPAGSNIIGGVTLAVTEIGLSGAQTRKATIFRQAGFGTWNAYADSSGMAMRIWVDDVGGT